MRDVLPELMKWWEAGETIGVGTVVATFQSAPRPPGASMLVGPDETAVGSVSGGCVEGAVVPEALDVIASGQPKMLEFGVADGRKGAQALGVKVLDAPPSVAELRRRPADELHGMVEDMIKIIESKVQPDLRRGRYPDKRTAQKVAQLVHAVARELEV